MGARSDSHTTVERTSDLDLVISRTFDAPVRIVYKAWTTPALFRQWWALKESGPMTACEMDVRTGGGYRVAFNHPAGGEMAFFGKYVDVVPDKRIVWTNEEGADGALTTVTFEAQGDKTLIRLHERYPTKEALDEAFIGMEGGTAAQFEQLAALLAENR